jgi:hypothetical protein
MSPFMGTTLSLERFMEMKAEVEKWAEETNHLVYPISVDPPPGRATNQDVVHFDITFRCIPKDQVATEITSAEWMALLRKPTEDSGTK